MEGDQRIFADILVKYPETERFVTNMEKFVNGGKIILSKLVRTRDISSVQEDILVQSNIGKLERCLGLGDLVSLGVGSCVATGMFVVAGMVAKTVAGPGVILSFLVAAIAAIFSGACYAEFGVRVPHTSGSAYSYIYVTMGEFLAFIIGWNMVLEYLIGTAACACAVSASLDALSEGAITDSLRNVFGNWFEGRPPDMLALGITMVLTLIMAAGAKKSMAFTHVLNAISLTTLVFIIGAGLFFIDSNNWENHGGFIPNGWSGVFSGAATCFYAFIGFDIIATTGEEALQPKRSIPLSIIISLGVILTAYVSSSAIITLMVPYNELHADSALIDIFGQVGAPICKTIVATGALAGLTVSLFGSMFPLPRVVYAMAIDGLIFRQLSRIQPLTGTPVLATLLCGTLAAIISLLFPLDILVEMMSIGPNQSSPGESHTNGTAIYQANRTVTVKKIHGTGSPDSEDTTTADDNDDVYLVSDRTQGRFYGSTPVGCNTGVAGGNPGRKTRLGSFISEHIAPLQYKMPFIFPWIKPGPVTEDSGREVVKLVGLLYLVIFVLDIFLVAGNDSSFVICITVILLLAFIFLLLLISRRPQNIKGLGFVAPGLPLVPAVAILVNIYLIFQLPILTLVRFVVWMSLGFAVYFFYGIKHSDLNSDHHDLEDMATPVKADSPVKSSLNVPMRNKDVDDPLEAAREQWAQW
ncbi:solute carrier family 7 member 14-like isoform X3 [Artemia franciscana]|uniref:solute carrier family 7 member 14-like isoform X3 n=1 Tax=Artemia franciscana TaxID=6661 RepID=UPI0032D9F4BA